MPFPWWTSKSATRTRVAPKCSTRSFAATAIVLKKQKPIACVASAWWPGGRAATKTAGARFSITASTAARTSPVARYAAENVAAEMGLSGQSKSENAVRLTRRRGVARRLHPRDVGRLVHALEGLERAGGVGRALEAPAVLAQRVHNGLQASGVLGVVGARVVLEKDGIVEDRHAAHGASVLQVWATIRR